MKENLNLSDEEYMTQYQAGQERAFTILYQRYSSRVYGYLKQRLRNQELVDDAFQGVFAKLHRSKDQFNSSFTFAPWLFTIARTVLLDTQKMHSRRTKHISQSEANFDLIEAPTVETADLSDVDLTVLPKPQREAIEMRYLKDLSFDEIAKRLETTPNNVRQLVSRGLRELKSLFVKAGS